MLIDTHAHLNFKAFNKDLPQVINRAKKAGISKIIIPGTKLDSSKKAINIAHQYESCFAAVGIHPHHATYESPEDLTKEITVLAKNKKVVAIGEVGLDYYQYRNYPPVSENNKKKQKEFLLLQLFIAAKIKLPVIFHCRNAFVDLLEILQTFLSVNRITGVFHCFSGEKDHLFKVLELGFFIGFDGNITYPVNKNLIDLVKLIPKEQFLLETDSPFLTPLPFRGNRNEPANLNIIVSFMAEICKKKKDFIARSTSDNALKLFNLLC